MTDRDNYDQAFRNAARRWADSMAFGKDLVAEVQKDPELQGLFTYAAREDIALEVWNLRRKASRQLPPI